MAAEPEHTVFRSEQSTDSTTCLSGQVTMYVIAFTPATGSKFGDMYMLRLVKVNSNRNISVRLLSNSLLVPTGVLHPTPLCQIAYVTLLLLFGALGRVKSAKNSMSISVSINSSASGFTSSNSSPAASNLASSSGDSSNSTSRASAAFLIDCQPSSNFQERGTHRVRFLLTPQKNLSSHDCNWSDSYKYGNILVKTRIQFSASLSGANSMSGNEG
jgi:hypothetical protein